ncbi:hypothetical protein [Thermococcus sp. MV11]|uniref:hypothetical protein n=1 Tax=Thermococcus sp. MV11 TaxID=1638267 RepID=UPI0014301DE7|nr:hypothetical protein [Thermococcus sp. MV11]NJE04455.1 hypothetical protein [Thermococcus sp. MV11]
MKKTSRILVLVLLSALVIIGGCIGNTPSPTETGSQTGENSWEGGISESTTTETQGTTETVTETVTQTETQTQTETRTSTETQTPANESLQFDEDGNVICDENSDLDLGCEAGERNENGTGIGFPILNVNLTPAIIPIYRLNSNLTYAGPLTGMASEPNGEIVEWVSILTSSREPGKSVALTIKFESEELAREYVHIKELRDLQGRVIASYRPTILKFDTGEEFGERWELHLYLGSFTLYSVTGGGLTEVQKGSVEIDGSIVRFTVENFSEIFPDTVFMRIEGNPEDPKTGQRFSYPETGKFIIKANLGRIDYYAPAYYGDAEGGVALYAEVLGDDVKFRLQFKDEETYEDFIPGDMFIDSTDNGEFDWYAEIGSSHFQLKDSSGSVYREEDVIRGETQLGPYVEFTVENLFSIIPWREFRFWFSNPVLENRFPAEGNLWFNATSGLSIEEDVDRYIVVVVEDVYIKGNKDEAEGEISLVSWAYGTNYYENLNKIEYSPIYVFGYPLRLWIEAEDHSRLLYHDRNAARPDWPFTNGYPVLAMPLDEAKKYQEIFVKTTGWDNDDLGTYVKLGAGFLLDAAVGLATGEISSLVEHGYTGVMLLHQLETGESASHFWGEALANLFGAPPDRVGYDTISFDPRRDYSDGYLVRSVSKDGNMVVTYIIYEVDLPRAARYARLELSADGLLFTKDTEWGDDEYYAFFRASTGFTPGNAEIDDALIGEITTMVPEGVAYAYPKLDRSSGTVGFSVGDFSDGKLDHGVINGNTVKIIPFGLTLVNLSSIRTPFVYVEYDGWEEDSGKWGNDDDPMGTFGITLLLDGGNFHWDPFSGIPRRSWGGKDFDVCGVSGGCSTVYMSAYIGP